MLAQVNARMMGVILNAVDVDGEDSYYYYYHYYGGPEKHYYGIDMESDKTA